MITFMDDVAMCIPSLDAWDQFVWPPGAAMPQATMEVEQYGYCHGQAIDLSPVMPVTQFRVTDEAGTYLCAVQALVFEGSILTYNPARDEADWVPTHSIANNLSWAEEWAAVVLANFVPHTADEAARIASLGAHCLVSWPDDSSQEEDAEPEEEEDAEPKDGEEMGVASPEPSPGGTALKEGETEEAKPHRCRWEWGSIMDEEEHLTFDDLWSDSNATISGCSPVRLTLWELGSPGETTVEVHARESEVEEL